MRYLIACVVWERRLFVELVEEFSGITLLTLSVPIPEEASRERRYGRSNTLLDARQDY